jgi:predicted phosphate transport protein (TIGR00153 family)
MARLSQIFAPREREFYDLFEEAGANVLRAAEMLDRMLRDWPETDLARDILIAEQEGDRITHDIIQRLNQTFVTPMDREDILALASALDDILDYTEEVADFMGLYRIEAPMDQALQLAGVLAQSARQIHQALPRLRNLDDISHFTVEIHRLENDGDRIARARARVAVRARDRPDDGHPVEGHLRAPRGGHRRDGDRGQRPAEHRDQERLTPWATRSSSSSSSGRRWPSTSRTVSTTPPTRWRPRSRPGR